MMVIALALLEVGLPSLLVRLVRQLLLNIGGRRSSPKESSARRLVILHDGRDDHGGTVGAIPNDRNGAKTKDAMACEQCAGFVDVRTYKIS